MTLIASLNDCGFPSYDFASAPSGGAGGASGGTAGGNGGSGALAGSSGSAGSGAAGAPVGDAGAAGNAGASGTAGNAGASGSAPCVYPTPITYPDHCFNNLTGDNETGSDCGGPDCLPCETNQQCVHDSDCASGTCTPGSTTCSQVLALQYVSIVTEAFTNGPKFRLVINYMDAKATALSDLSIRYYFNHNGVAEPVIALDTQATLSQGSSVMDISSKLNAVVHRLPPGPPAKKGGQITDSYLEITFSSTFQLAAGGALDLTADIIAGSSDVKFQQSSHYSFSNVSALTPTDTITVFRKGQRVWGTDPPLVTIPDCAYARGVNLGGPSVTLGANGEGPTLAAADDKLTFTGTLYSSTTPKPLPATDANTTKMLSSAVTFTSADTATWSVPSGRYWLYAWLTSAASTDTGLLSVQDTPLDAFSGLQRGGGAGWAQLGPYPIEVTDAVLRASTTGKVNVAGLALYKQAP